MGARETERLVKAREANGSASALTPARSACLPDGGEDRPVASWGSRSAAFSPRWPPSALSSERLSKGAESLKVGLFFFFSFFPSCSQIFIR